MRLVDAYGHILGHDIPHKDLPLYENRSDVTFLSDDFIMYPDVQSEGQTFMEMISMPYYGQGDWVPESADAILWFASVTSSDMIHEYFGHPKSNLATAMIGVNL